jgi:hypothetical protein
VATLSSNESCSKPVKETSEIFSHNVITDSKAHVAGRVASIKKRLQSTDPTLLALPLDETLKILEEMEKCDGLGKWLLMHQGLNGFWTAEAILRFGGESPSNIARWITTHAPIFRATCERFKIFQKVLQRQLDNGAKTFISVPCGTMEELLTLNTSCQSDVRFIGIDLDSQAEAWVKEASTRYNNVTSHKEFHQADAYNLSSYVKNADVIVSNGLNFYIQDDAEVIRLYKAFADSLKLGGILITSHLSPPTLAEPYDKEALKKQLAIVRDICEMRWQIFRPEALVKAQLAEAGLEVQEVIWDTQKMFPTYVCKKVR